MSDLHEYVVYGISVQTELVTIRCEFETAVSLRRLILWQLMRCKL